MSTGRAGPAATTLSTAARAEPRRPEGAACRHPHRIPWCSLPVRPATSAGACWRRSRPTGCTCAAWHAARRRCAVASGPSPKSPQGISATPSVWPRHWRVSTSPTTWSTRWARRAPLPTRTAQAAKVFADAARAAGVARIVYLGGLGSGNELSDHLASRQEVGRVLAASGVPTVEFRAGIVIGSGSLAFDAMRALVRQLPIMIVPRWVGHADPADRHRRRRGLPRRRGPAWTGSSPASTRSAAPSGSRTAG